MSMSTLTSKGQITLPSEVRKHFGVGKGDQLDFRIGRDGSVTVQRLGGSVRNLFGLLHRPGARPVTQEEMDPSIVDHLDAEDQRIRGGQ